MPELDDDQIQPLREALERREGVLQEEVRDKGRGGAEAPGGESADVEDSGEQGEHRIRDAVVQAEQNRDLDELRQIGGAKARMARGDYGACIDCGVAIPIARLEVQPAAARCIPCQEAFEASRDNAVRIPPLGG